MQQRHELALARQPAHAGIGRVLIHKPVEGAPRNELQQTVQESILVAHGVGLFRVR